MRIFPALIALMALVALMAPVSEAADMKEGRPPLAERYFQEGNWEKAITEYNKAEPTVENLNRLADAYFYSDDFNAAKKTFKKALKLRENPDSRIYYTMLKAMKSKKHMDKLMEMFQQTHGDDPRLWRAAGIALMRNKRDERAIYYFYGATDKDPKDYMSYYYIGLMYETHHEYDEGIKLYKEAVAINPRFVPALNNLAYCYKERHYYSYAIEVFKQAMEVQPDNSGIYYNIGNVYTHKKMTEEAYASYKKALELDPKFAKAHYNMGRTYIRMDRLEDAIEEMKLYVKYWDRSIPERDAPHPDKVKEMMEEIKYMVEEEKNRLEEETKDKEKQDNG